MIAYFLAIVWISMKYEICICREAETYKYICIEKETIDGLFMMGKESNTNHPVKVERKFSSFDDLD
jgi:hypothetical protein